SIFFAPSRKFKILTIPNLLGLGKLNNLGFTKKNMMVIKFAQSRCLNDFFHIISKIQNIDHSQLIRRREVE
ncbi:hypothetical protein MUK42_23700, partial [Musa troglodytarum]